MDRRVADALQLIADHVLKQGMDHPEGLKVVLPYYVGNEEIGELHVVAHVHLDEHDDQAISMSHRVVPAPERTP